MDLLDKINELVNDITIEKLSSISGENKLKVEESLKACITTIFYSLLYKNSEDLDKILQVSDEIMKLPINGQNFSILLKTIYGDQLEKILFNIAESNDTKIETIHLVANTAVVSVIKTIEILATNFEVYFVKNLLSNNKEKITAFLPEYIDKEELEKSATFNLIVSPLKAEDVYKTE